MSHLARLYTDGVEAALLRNRIPLAWPLLLDPSEVEIVDRVAYGESFQQVQARAAGDAVAERLATLAKLSHPLFEAAPRLVPWFEGVDEVIFDVDDIDALGDPGWTVEPLRRGAEVLAGDLVGLGRLAEALEWRWWLRDPEHRMATRLTEMDRVRETVHTLAFGYPADTEPFQAWWSEGPASPGVSSATDDAAQFLAALEAAGVVRVTKPKWAQPLITIAMRSRELDAVVECLEAAERMGNLERERRWLGLASAPEWDRALLERLLADLPP